MKLSDYCVGYDYDSFRADTKLVDAYVFNLSQIGELCHTVDDEFAEIHPGIPWREMNGLGNHDYEGVNLKFVWEIISEDIPKL